MCVCVCVCVCVFGGERGKFHVYSFKTYKFDFYLRKIMNFVEWLWSKTICLFRSCKKKNSSAKLALASKVLNIIRFFGFKLTEVLWTSHFQNDSAVYGTNMRTYAEHGDIPKHLGELFFYFVSHPPPAIFRSSKNTLFFLLTGGISFCGARLLLTTPPETSAV